MTVVKVVRKDAPLQREWLASLDGYVNADIQPQIGGYLVKQSYTEGKPVKKGDVLFEIDPRPSRAALARSRALLAQSEAELAKARLDVERDRPLAEARAIARSQLDNDVQAAAAAQARLDSARAALQQSQLDVNFTKVRSLVNGIAGVARGQIGDLVGPTTVLTTVSQVDPIKAWIAMSEQEYIQFAATGDADQPLPAGEDLKLVLGDGSVHPEEGTFVLADRQVDPTTGTIRVLATFPNPQRRLRPGQFGRVRAITSVERNALLDPAAGRDRAPGHLPGGGGRSRQECLREAGRARRARRAHGHRQEGRQRRRDHRRGRDPEGEGRRAGQPGRRAGPGAGAGQRAQRGGFVDPGARAGGGPDGRQGRLTWPPSSSVARSSRSSSRSSR